MNFVTLADVKASRMITRVAGSCTESTKFLGKLNEATERLMTRGDWATTFIPIHVCVKRGCVTWPRFVGAIRRINICNTPVPVTNPMAPYLPRDMWGAWYNWPGLVNWAALSTLYTLGDTLFGDSLAFSRTGVNKTGYYSTYNDPLGDRYIRAYPQFPEDVGKTVTIFGNDENGQPLVHESTDSSGNKIYKPGHVITIANPYGSSSVVVQKPIDRVIKDETIGRVWLYAYNATDDVLEDLAVYEPTETNPTYERTRIPGLVTASNSSCDNTSVMAMVKLKYIPVKYDTDLVQIPSMPALKRMIQAINFEDANDFDEAAKAEVGAIRELNLQLADQFPITQTPVTVEPFNTTGVGRMRCF